MNPTFASLIALALAQLALAESNSPQFRGPDGLAVASDAMEIPTDFGPEKNVDFYASPVAAAGKLYVAAQNGAVAVLAARDAFEVLAKNELGEPIFATPAIADGRIYLRTAGRLYCSGAATTPLPCPCPWWFPAPSAV